MVSLREIPERGDAKVLVEMEYSERDTLGYAAALCGLSKQKFSRAVLVSAAHRVLKEMGVKIG
jgi:hypothetical protein